MSAMGGPGDDGGPVAGAPAAALAAVGIPPCPRILAVFMQQMARAEPDLRALSALILSDAGLATAVLKMANSAFFGTRARAGSVRAALTMLGLRNCANLIAALLLRRAFPRIGDPAMKVFWESSSRCGNAMVFLGPELAVAPAGEAHTFGLFRNCGVPPLLVRYFDYGNVFLEEHERGIRDIAGFELARYGVDHAAIGARIAREWRLPDLICGAIGLHHFDDQAPEPRPSADGAVRLAAAGVVAECAKRLLRAPRLPEVWSDRLARAVRILDISAGRLEQLREPVTRAIERGPDLFGDFI